MAQLDPVEPFERQHAPRGPPPVDFGNVEAGLGDHIVAQLGRRGAFALEVELAPGPLLEMLDDEARAEPFEFAPGALDVERGPLVGFDRLGEFFLDPRAEHLDRDLAALGGDRMVDLGDRCGADGHLVEFAEQGFERSAERGLDRRLDRREWLGRERILKLEEVGRGGIADQIGTGGQRLAQFDRGGADRLQRGGVIGIVGHARAEARDAGEAADEWRGQRIALDPGQRPVAGKRAAPFEQPPDVDDERWSNAFQPP